MKRKQKLEEDYSRKPRTSGNRNQQTLFPHAVARQLNNDKKVRTSGGDISSSISSTKSRRKKMLSSEERYRSLFETMVLGVTYQDRKGRITDANKAAERILGLTISQMQGHDLTTSKWHTIHEDGSEFPVNEHPSMVAINTGELIKDTIMGIFHPTEEKYIWININAVPQFIPGESKPYQVFTTFEDITDRINAEKELRELNRVLEEKIRERTEEFRDLFDKAPVGIHSIDSNGNFIAVNQTELDWLGYTREELLGKHLMTIIAPESANIFLKTFPLLKRTGKAEGIEFSVLRKNGTTFPAEANITAVYDNDGNFSGTRSTYINITKRKQAIEAKNEAIIAARIANKAKSEFLLNVSHEFRTPLNAVIGYADLIDQAEDDDRKTYSGSIKSAGRRLLAMVEDILDFIRSEKGELELENQEVALQELLEEISNDFADKTAEKGLKFTPDISSGLPAYIITDGLRFKQVIVNLLDNAVKFTEKGEIIFKVSVSGNKMINGGTKLFIEVRDTGRGMTDEFQKKMFEVFAQADKKTILCGIGLGLPLVQLIVSKMKGSIEVTSQPEMGSSFVVTLPLSVSEEPEHNIVLQKPDEIQVTGEVCNDEVSDLPDLILKLENEYLEKVVPLQKRQPIGDVKNLGKTLTELGRIHTCRLITEYGQNLQKAAEHFDIDSMLNLIRKYSDIINKLRS